MERPKLRTIWWQRKTEKWPFKPIMVQIRPQEFRVEGATPVQLVLCHVGQRTREIERLEPLDAPVVPILPIH